jgi:hypothetical protein
LVHFPVNAGGDLIFIKSFLSVVRDDDAISNFWADSSNVLGSNVVLGSSVVLARNGINDGTIKGCNAGCGMICVGNTSSRDSRVNAAMVSVVSSISITC